MVTASTIWSKRTNQILCSPALGWTSTAFSTSDTIPCVEELGQSTGGRSPVFTLWQSNHLSALQLNPREVDGALMQNTRRQQLQVVSWRCPGRQLYHDAQLESREAACCPASQNKSNSYSSVSILMLVPQSFLVTNLQPNVPQKFFSILHASLFLFCLFIFETERDRT